MLTNSLSFGLCTDPPLAAFLFLFSRLQFILLALWPISICAITLWPTRLCCLSCIHIPSFLLVECLAPFRFPMVAGAPLVIIGPWQLRQSISMAAGDIRWCRQPPATRRGAGNRLHGKAASGKTIIYPKRKWIGKRLEWNDNNSEALLKIKGWF